MSQPLFTVLIPTHDHADTLYHAIGSVQAQTLQDFEIIVVGDGAPARTQEIMDEICAGDSRVRYFAYSKGERLGERHRHEALQHANGRYVAYLADDDLWFPEHLELIAQQLQHNDFAYSIQIVQPPNGGQPFTWRFNHELDKDWLNCVGGMHGIGMGCVAHTMAFYRRLPLGWSPAPMGIASDVTMFKQIMSVAGARGSRTGWPTVLHIPSNLRKGVPLPDRWIEIAEYANKIRDVAWRNNIVRRTLIDSSEDNYRALRHLELRAELLAKACARETSPEHRRQLLLGAAGKENDSELRTACYSWGEKVTFGNDGFGSQYLVCGFDKAEIWGAWCIKKYAMIAVPLPELPQVPIRFTMHYQIISPLDYTMAVNGHLLLSRRDRGTSMGVRSLSVIIEPELLCGRQFLLVEFHIRNPASPSSIDGSRDQRVLGMGALGMNIDKVTQGETAMADNLRFSVMLILRNLVARIWYIRKKYTRAGGA